MFSSLFTSSILHFMITFLLLFGHFIFRFCFYTVYSFDLGLWTESESPELAQTRDEVPKTFTHFADLHYCDVTVKWFDWMKPLEHDDGSVGSTVAWRGCNLYKNLFHSTGASALSISSQTWTNARRTSATMPTPAETWSEDTCVTVCQDGWGTTVINVSDCSCRHQNNGIIQHLLVRGEPIGHYVQFHRLTREQQLPGRLHERRTLSGTTVTVSNRLHQHTLYILIWCNIMTTFLLLSFCIKSSIKYLKILELHLNIYILHFLKWAPVEVAICSLVVGVQY